MHEWGRPPCVACEDEDGNCVNFPDITLRLRPPVVLENEGRIIWTLPSVIPEVLLFYLRVCVNLRYFFEAFLLLLRIKEGICEAVRSSIGAEPSCCT
ncbi:hypothetical protein CEXT_787341 [Caerostris extrusa]|uniref:Uncharacterized protein n=1 Tax=Caerostris extrusa TaxID=172846 RepID=A0AAV4VN79_CAEEX|nr:hypothetical protein CEXT_787341 [Caerostris extrusa]